MYTLIIGIKFIFLRVNIIKNSRDRAYYILYFRDMIIEYICYVCKLHMILLYSLAVVINIYHHCALH